MQFLASLEHSAFSTWVRESGSLWAYPGILFMHTVGLALLVGPSTVIDFRILGVAPRVSLRPMRGVLPVMWLGFWINAVTGSMLLAADATTKLTNPAFAVKMGFIALAIVNIFLIKRQVFENTPPAHEPLPLAAKVLAVTSLFFWVGAITAGRLMAYFGRDSGAPEFINRIGG